MHYALYKWRPRMAAMERGVMTQAGHSSIFIASLFQKSTGQKAGGPYDGLWFSSPSLHSK